MFRSDSRLVVLHATVLDEENRLVTDLPKSAFQLYENGKPQQIKVFRQEDVPVSMGLVLDDSSSMQPKRERLASAALALVRASHPGDEVFLLNFNEEAYLDTDFTRDIGRLEDGLARIQAKGITAMRDAARLGLEHLFRRGKEDKKVLIVVTDGEDNASRISLDQLVRAAQHTGAIIYTVGILDGVSRQETRRAQRDLDGLAHATGGQSYYINDVAQVEDITRQIARDIRNQYTIAYTPADESLDGGFRRIEIEVKDPNRPVLSVRSRNGYYALPEQSAQTGTTNAQ